MSGEPAACAFLGASPVTAVARYRPAQPNARVTASQSTSLRMAHPAPSLLASLRADPGRDLFAAFSLTLRPVQAFVMVTPINLGQLGIQRC